MKYIFFINACKLKFLLSFLLIVFYNRARPSFNNDNNNNVTRGNSVFRSSYPCSVTMAANISDIDVITDVEGIDIPECAHGIFLL